MLQRVGLLIAAVALCLLPVRALADEPKNRGLFISPIRAYPNVSPGGTATNTFTVANITEQPATIDVSIQQFSVQDYTYDYQFTKVSEDWISLNKTQLELQPNKSQSITYTIRAPKDATPGGHYFTLFATATFPGNPNKVRTATVLYVTIDGELHKTSRINNITIPNVSFGSDINFNMDVTNTGNTHYFVYSSGRLEGLSAKSEQPQQTILLLPDKSRIVGSTILAPLLPGIYQAVFGFKVDDGQIVERKQLIVYLPPWAILLPLGLAWLVYAIRRYRRAH